MYRGSDVEEYLSEEASNDLRERQPSPNGIDRHIYFVGN